MLFLLKSDTCCCQIFLSMLQFGVLHLIFVENLQFGKQKKILIVLIHLRCNIWCYLSTEMYQCIICLSFMEISKLVHCGLLYFILYSSLFLFSQKHHCHFSLSCLLGILKCQRMKLPNLVRFVGVIAIASPVYAWRE